MLKDSYRFKNSHAHLLLMEDGAIISWIHTPKKQRNQGQAKELLRLIVADADCDLYLVVEPEEHDIERDRLERLYHSFGFVRMTHEVPFIHQGLVRRHVTQE